jgi:hypothetical protein
MRRRQTPRPTAKLFHSPTGASNQAPSTALVG